MPQRKTYEPHCPASDCSGGHRAKLHPVKVETVPIPAEVLRRRGESDSVYRCSYCQFVWFQSSSPPGFDLIPAGFYDNFRWPGEFKAAPEDYKVREEIRQRTGIVVVDFESGGDFKRGDHGWPGHGVGVKGYGGVCCRPGQP